MVCPWCKKAHDTATGISSHDRPTAGDVFICINCGRVNIVLGASELRKPTHDELAEYMDEMPELRMALLAWKITQRKRNRM
jgi:hypothetical protein